MRAPDDRPPMGGRPTITSYHRQATYTRWLRWHLVAAVVTFCASTAIGYAVTDVLTAGGLSDSLPNSEVLPAFGFWPILANNLQALLLMALGAVTGGLLALFGLFVNGVLVGSVVALAAREVSWIVILAALLPHGILELPAFFVAAAIGLRIPHRIARYLLGWDETPITRVELFEATVIGVILVVAIAVAAWIEVFVTPDVIDVVGGEDLPSP